MFDWLKHEHVSLIQIYIDGLDWHQPFSVNGGPHVSSNWMEFHHSSDTRNPLIMAKEINEKSMCFSHPEYNVLCDTLSLDLIE